MYYYAYIDESNTCTGVYALPSQITTDNYIPITEEQYNTQSVVGKVWDAETQTWNDPIVFACTTDEVDYKETGVQLTEKLDAMDAAIAGKANSSDLHSHSNKAVLDGITAEKVATWDSGTAGESGENGATFTPSVSTDGVLSWTNDKGLANPTPVNIKGADGTNGAKGDKGDKGDPFTYEDFTAAQLAALKGEKGDTGDQGVKGDTGATGANGQDGKSAYQIALDNGFEGTETQWLASLKGAKGDKGDNGESGADITATEILTKLKTVDGQNSGLDADMLDGHNTDYFATATQLDGKANTDHTHTEYAAVNHTHTAYATKNHTHTEYAAADHTHNGYATTASVTAVENALDGKANASHTHTQSNITGLETALAGKADSNHNHDTAYATIDHTHDGYAAVNHTHTEYATTSDVSALENDISGKADVNHTHSGYAPTSHTHSQDDIAGLSTALAGKASTSHTHTGYAATNHTHSGYASTSHTHSNYLPTSGGTISGDVNVTGLVKVGGQQCIYNSGTMVTLSTNNRETMIAGSKIYSKVQISVSSDERLKENIKAAPISDLVSLVDNLDVKTFNYIGKEEENIGVIAQELIKENPDLAKYFVRQDENGYYSVKTADLVFPLIVAVQELTKRLNDLEAQH